MGKLYWVITTVAYILGLIATFISLFVMNSAQPALLYLVPFTLIPTIIVAWIRGDLPAMWEGDNKAVVRRNGGVPGDDTVPQSAQDEEDGDVCGDDSDADDDNDDDDERKAAVVQDPSVSTPDKNKLLAQ